MTELREILNQVDRKQRPLAEQVIRYLEREHNGRTNGLTVDALARLSIETLESAFKAVKARHPSFKLNDKARASFAQRIQNAAKKLAEAEREREERRLARPAVALDDLAKSLKVPPGVKNAWKATKVKSIADLLKPAAAKVLLNKAVPVKKRRELLAMSKLAVTSRNLKLSHTLYDQGVSSLTRLARMPEQRLTAILDKAKMDEDSRRDARELHRQARWVHRQAQALAVRQGSARYNFGPEAAHAKKDNKLKGSIGMLGLDPQQDPLEVGSSCATCTECENAFSPLGYLFDLLDFINDQWQVTVDELEKILLQPIKDLDCVQAQTPTAQIQIAIQVLEKSIGGQILRNDSNWQQQYQKTGDALVQLLSQWKQLHPALTSVAELSGDQRFAGNPDAQALIAALSSTSPALAELDAAERSLRAIIEADIDAKYPLPQEPAAGASDEQMVAYLMERARQEQNKDIARQEFEKQLALILESTWVDYRRRLIRKKTPTFPFPLIQEPEKSERMLENQLFIYLTAAPCHRTTPITQVILSLQAFVLAVRTGRMAALQQTSRLAPIIGSTDFSAFDEETWSWLETYNTWASAMYTFLYPENLVGLPSLRDPISPSFRKVMNTLSLSATSQTVDDNLREFENDLQQIGQLSLLAAHVVASELYVFARHGSFREGQSIWMNIVDLRTHVSKGWGLVVKGKENLRAFDVAPVYGNAEVRFIVGFEKIKEAPSRRVEEIQCRWIDRQGRSEPGPDVPQPNGVENISSAYLALARRNDQPVTLIYWQATINGVSSEQCYRLSADGTWETPSFDVPQWSPLPTSLVGHISFTAERTASAGTGNLAVRNLQTDQLSTLPIAFDDAGGLGGRVSLATNPESMQTYVVVRSSSDNITAFSQIDLAAMSLANDWHVLSTSLDLMEKDFEAFTSAGGGDAVPLVLRHLYIRRTVPSLSPGSRLGLESLRRLRERARMAASLIRPLQTKISSQIPRTKSPRAREPSASPRGGDLSVQPILRW